MPGFQFIHLSTFASQVSGKRRAASGRTVRDVLAEAARLPGDCPHVHSPASPHVLYGLDPVAALAEHDRRRDEARKLKRGAGRGRGQRADAHTLAVVVASHPAPCADLPEAATRRAYEAWRADTIEWIRGDFARQGIELLGVVEHMDERHPHLHAYGVPCDLMAFDVRLAHPGHQAARNAPSGAGVAYRTAMREWQNDYHAVVAVAHGLTRLGPARRRLSRADWRREQAAAEAAAKALYRAEEATAVAKAMEARIAERDSFSVLLERQATTLRDAAAVDRGAALSERIALTTAVNAWAAGEVIRVQPAPEGQLGLIFASSVPKIRRIALTESLSPAWDAVCQILHLLTELVQAVPTAAREATRHALAERWVERTRGPRSH